MSALYQIVSLTGLSSLVGLLAIIALIWYLGPLLAISGYAPFASESSRIMAAVVIVAVFVLYKLLRWFQARARNRRMTRGLAQAEDPLEAQTKTEVATLNQVFDQALQELKKARLGEHGRVDLYQLPWYVIIGPPGAGKTTALVNSGLNFPLAKRLGTSKIKGVGGTRNCDWWFTDQAVLLDTAGRYTTQDSQETVDSAAWLAFLKLLKKYRRQRPINGVLVAVSCGDLLTQDEAQRSAHALTIRKRIQELHEHLGIRFPVYVLLTKIDLLAGCMEFFDDLDGEGRSQVWGMTFPLDKLTPDDDGVVGRFSSEFDLLQQRLEQRLLKRLQDERDPARRDLIYLFPQQFASLKRLAQEFLDELFQPNRFEQRTLLRGVYFTSGTQEGHPIDRLMGALAATFGIARQNLARFSGKGRSYFLARLFRDVVFREFGLAGTNFRLAQRRLWLARAAYVAVAVVTLGMGAAWLNSYAGNGRYVTAVRQQLDGLRVAAGKITPEQRSLRAVLPLLDRARAIPGAVGKPAEPGWSQRLGLYQGDKLATSAATAYHNILDRAFLSRLMIYIEDRIKQQLRELRPDQQQLYQALKAYLMLDRSKAGKHFDAAFLKHWLSQRWQQDKHLTDSERQRLERHLASLLVQLPDSLPLVPNQTLIKQARERLPGRLDAAQFYQQLRRGRYGIADFAVSEAAGREAAAAFYRLSGAPLNSGVAGIFTKPGQVVFIKQIQQHIKDLASGDWVSALPPLPLHQLEQLSAQVQQLYWHDYCPQWQKLLGDLALNPPDASLQDAIDRLQMLSGADSPLRKLLLAVSKQVAGVPDCMKDLTRFLQGSPSGLDQLLKSLNEVAVQLAPLAKARADGRNLDQQASDKIMGLLDALPLGKPAPLGKWVRGLTEPIPIALYAGLRATINNVWQRDVLSYCQRALNGRYPLEPGSSQGVSLVDFGKFFGPGGVMNTFTFQGEQHLTTFIDMTKSPWRWRSFGDGPGIPSSRLAVLQLANEIKRAFFSNNSDTPHVSFQLSLAAVDARIKRVELQLNGQQVSFMPGMRFSAPLQWPGATANPRALLELYPNTGGPVRLATSGPWDWFRLLDKGRLRAQSDDRFTVSFNVGGYDVRFNLQAASVFNPFRLKMSRFRCLRNL